MGKTTDTKKSSSGRLAAAVIAAGLVIAGCSAEEPEPDFTPTMPPSKSSSTLDGEDEEAQPNPAASPDLKPPPIPPEIEEKTLEGAEAAARYYIDAFNYGYAMRDSEPMEFISLTKCESCAIHIDSIQELASQNRMFLGGWIELEDTDEIYKDGEQFLVTFPGNQEPFSILETNGDVVTKGDGGPFTAKLLAKFEDGQWKISATANEQVDA